MTIMRRLLPHPALSITVMALWVVLVNEVSLGAIVFGALLGVAIPRLTSAYWPGHPVIRRPARIPGYVAIVLWDILVSSFQVAYLVLFRRGTSLRSQFITVPIELQSPEAITVLAGTITMTPGTLSADLAADGSAILVHCLEADDPEDATAQIKARYERRLKEIFE